MSFWGTIYRFSWGVLGILFLVLVGSMFVPQIKQYRELQRKKVSLEAEIRLEEDILKNLKEKQERLENDPRFVERIAREELGLAKSGETVFKFVDDEGPPDVNEP